MEWLIYQELANRSSQLSQAQARPKEAKKRHQKQLEPERWMMMMRCWGRCVCIACYETAGSFIQKAIGRSATKRRYTLFIYVIFGKATSLLKMVLRNSWFSYFKWWCSLVFNVYQRNKHRESSEAGSDPVEVEELVTTARRLKPTNPETSKQKK